MKTKSLSDVGVAIAVLCGIEFVKVKVDEIITTQGWTDSTKSLVKIVSDNLVLIAKVGVAVQAYDSIKKA